MDAKLDRLNDACEQAEIEASLAWDAVPPDLIKLAQLQRILKKLEGEIQSYRPDCY